MKKSFYSIVALTALFLASCSKSPLTTNQNSNENDMGDYSQQNKKGVLTGAEWNDLDNWTFWTDLISKSDYSNMPSHWGFYNTNRISVLVRDGNLVVQPNTLLELQLDGTTIFKTKTDNFGRAELWPNLFANGINLDIKKMQIKSGSAILKNLKPFNEGVNELTVNSSSNSENTIEVAFVMDATASMGDELEYLKTELKDVITRVKQSNTGAKVRTSSIVYRDQGDDYLTRVSNFSDDATTTINFLDKQSAGGGGDYPEAMHSALDKSINELTWTNNSKTKIVFLIMDAPPHFNSDIVTNLQDAVIKANEMGIKLIPVAASGADKDTEFLLRFLGMSTNATYAFLTNDSGVGQKHLIASVGACQIEYLNNMMVRLINKYSN